MENYKLSGAIRKDKKLAFMIFNLIVRIGESGRRINGDTISDVTSEMLDAGEIDADLRRELVSIADNNDLPTELRLITQAEYFKKFK